MDDKPVVNKVEARQGTTAPGLRYVLIGGIILVVLALGAAALFVH